MQITLPFFNWLFFLSFAVYFQLAILAKVSFQKLRKNQTKAKNIFKAINLF